MEDGHRLCGTTRGARVGWTGFNPRFWRIVFFFDCSLKLN
jgi:hypothetical protein